LPALGRSPSRSVTRSSWSIATDRGSSRTTSTPLASSARNGCRGRRPNEDGRRPFSFRLRSRTSESEAVPSLEIALHPNARHAVLVNLMGDTLIENEMFGGDRVPYVSSVGVGVPTRTVVARSRSDCGRARARARLFRVWRPNARHAVLVNLMGDTLIENEMFGGDRVPYVYLQTAERRRRSEPNRARRCRH
jgi:hypothetical protein